METYSRMILSCSHKKLHHFQNHVLKKRRNQENPSNQRGHILQFVVESREYRTIKVSRDKGRMNERSLPFSFGCDNEPKAKSPILLPKLNEAYLLSSFMYYYNPYRKNFK
jgi:hypothetical protein